MLELEVVPERSLGCEQWEFILGKWRNTFNVSLLRVTYYALFLRWREIYEENMHDANAQYECYSKLKKSYQRCRIYGTPFICILLFVNTLTIACKQRNRKRMTMFVTHYIIEFVLFFVIYLQNQHSQRIIQYNLLLFKSFPVISYLLRIFIFFFLCFHMFHVNLKVRWEHVKRTLRYSIIHIYSRK